MKLTALESQYADRQISDDEARALFTEIKSGVDEVVREGVPEGGLAFMVENGLLPLRPPRLII